MLAAMAVGALALALHPATPGPEKFIAAQHATAVLAWSQARCPWAGELQPNAPKAQLEDLMAVAAAFDAKTRYQPLRDVCAQALALAAPVSSPAGSKVPQSVNLLAAR